MAGECTGMAGECTGMAGGMCGHGRGMCGHGRGCTRSAILPADFQYKHAICPDSEYSATRQVYLPYRALSAQHIVQRIEQARHLALIRYRQMQIRFPVLRIPAQQSG